MSSLQDTHEDDENDWEILLIDALGALNEGSLKMMACTARPQCSLLFCKESGLKLATKNGPRCMGRLIR